MLADYSRDSFERSVEPEILAARLRAVLLPRLIAASDRLSEAHAIVNDLRRAGHALWSWDESEDFSAWGDDYANPPLRTRFLIQMRWPSEENPSQPVDIVITFGLWPTATGA